MQESNLPTVIAISRLTSVLGTVGQLAWAASIRHAQATVAEARELNDGDGSLICARCCRVYKLQR